VVPLTLLGNHNTFSWKFCATCAGFILSLINCFGSFIIFFLPLAHISNPIQTLPIKSSNLIWSSSGKLSLKSDNQGISLMIDQTYCVPSHNACNTPLVTGNSAHIEKAADIKGAHIVIAFCIAHSQRFNMSCDRVVLKVLFCCGDNAWYALTSSSPKTFIAPSYIHLASAVSFNHSASFSAHFSNTPPHHFIVFSSHQPTKSTRLANHLVAKDHGQSYSLIQFDI